MQLLAVVGYKNSGKTTLIARLIPALHALGMTCSTVKHIHHSIDLDRPGKDTFIHREAGATDVVVMSEDRWAILHERRHPSSAQDELADVVGRLSPVDVVLCEGYKSLPYPKIQILADDAAIDETAVALVSDTQHRATLPVFARGDIEGLAAFVRSYHADREAAGKQWDTA